MARPGLATAARVSQVRTSRQERRGADETPGLEALRRVRRQIDREIAQAERFLDLPVPVAAYSGRRQGGSLFSNRA